MLSGRPLFPGRDYSHQLELILDVIGTPTLEEFYGITSRRSRDYIRSLPIRKRRPFTALFPQASVEAIDFLNRTLVSDAQHCPSSLCCHLFFDSDTSPLSDL
jgi:mitogen-activated protein kinase 1/3